MAADILTTTFLNLRSRLHRLAAAILHDADEADDVLHDAYLRLWSRGERDERQTAGSLVIAVRNGCIDRLRQKSHIDSEAGVMRQATDSEAGADAREDVEMIMHFVHTQLSPQAAKAFEMYVADDLGYDEIAKRLGISVELARTYISRSRKRIRKQFNNLS